MAASFGCQSECDHALDGVATKAYTCTGFFFLENLAYLLTETETAMAMGADTVDVGALKTRLTKMHKKNTWQRLQHLPFNEKTSIQ